MESWVLLEKLETTDKPGSVVDNHSSGTDVTICLKQPTQEQYGSHMSVETNVPLFGLAPGGVYHATSVTRSAVRSYRTLSPLPYSEEHGGILSVALAVGFHPPGVTWHLTLWSPDFPHQRIADAIVWSSLSAILPKHDYFC